MSGGTMSVVHGGNMSGGQWWLDSVEVVVVVVGL
jgi:hypothetical protein